MVYFLLCFRLVGRNFKMSNRALRKLQGEAANKKEEEESGEEEEAVVVVRGGGGGFNAFLLVSEAFPGVKKKM